MSANHNDIPKFIAVNLISDDAAPQGAVTLYEASKVMIVQGVFQGRKGQGIQHPWPSGHCGYKLETTNSFHHNCKMNEYRIMA